MEQTDITNLHGIVASSYWWGVWMSLMITKPLFMETIRSDPPNETHTAGRHVRAVFQPLNKAARFWLFAG